MKTYFEYDLAIAVLESSLETDIAEYNEIEEDSILESILEEAPSKKQGKIKTMISKFIQMIKTFFAKIAKFFKDMIKKVKSLLFKNKKNSNKGEIEVKVTEKEKEILETDVKVFTDDFVKQFEEAVNDTKGIIDNGVNKTYPNINKTIDSMSDDMKREISLMLDPYQKLEDVNKNLDKISKDTKKVEKDFIEKAKNVEEPEELVKLNEAKADFDKAVKTATDISMQQIAIVNKIENDKISINWFPAVVSNTSQDIKDYTRVYNLLKYIHTSDKNKIGKHLDIINEDAVNSLQKRKFLSQAKHDNWLVNKREVVEKLNDKLLDLEKLLKDYKDLRKHMEELELRHPLRDLYEDEYESSSGHYSPITDVMDILKIAINSLSEYIFDIKLSLKEIN